MTVQIGLIAWPVARGGNGPGGKNTLPVDQAPGERQLAQLRAMGGEGAGWWPPRAAAKKPWRPDHTNITAQCTCRHVFPVDTSKADFWEPDVNCPIHAIPDERDQVNEDTWPR